MATPTFSSPVFDNSPKRIRFNESENDVAQLIWSNGIYDRYEMQWFDKFTRFGIIDPYNALTNTREYIFVTKPDLCLMDRNSGHISPLLANNTFFNGALDKYMRVAQQLQSSSAGQNVYNSSPFMTILSNSVTSTLSLPGLDADMIESAANVMGTKISYRSTSHKSDIDFDFNLEFEDTRHLDVYMLFKMWDEYEKLKWDGGLNFNDLSDNHWMNYTINKILHDQVTIYKFIVDQDGYRIVYYARITGCVPNSIPRDAFSDTTDTSPQKLTVGWKGHFVRDMDPIILKQFNYLVLNQAYTGGGFYPLYNNEINAMDGRFARTPYIDSRNVATTGHGNHKEYYLRWIL